MMGTSESYPNYDAGTFPHSLSIDVNMEMIKAMIIALRDVAEIKKNPNDDFAILTLKKYLEPHKSIQPLCLPENPNQFYDNVESKTEIYGFGYDIHFKQTLKDIAKMEKAQNKMLKSSRADTVKETKVLSRKECLQKFGKHGDVLEGKGGPEDMILKV